jgi:hypothetical protein
MACWLAQAICGVTIKFGRSIPIEAGTPDHTSLQCKCQGLFVDEAVSGRVDEQGIMTHHRQLFRADHAASLLREGRMKGDDVAFLKNGEKIDEPRLCNDIGRQHLHSESLRAPSERLANLTETDNPERRASDTADRMRKEAVAS